MNEQEVIKRIANGEKQYAIAESLGMDVANFEIWMRKTVRPKYGAKNSPHLVAIAYQKGILK